MLSILISSTSIKAHEPSSLTSLSDLKVLGSHNSYKKRIQPELFSVILDKVNVDITALEYGHPSLLAQLEHGLRNFELDVLYDPMGGRYASPAGHAWLKEKGIEPEEFDPAKKMLHPGFKVLHIPDIDFATNCYTLADCLTELRLWSDKNLKHLPISITFNAKVDNFKNAELVQPLAFDAAAFNALDGEFKQILGLDKIVTPADVRGSYSTLKEAVVSAGWPPLEEMRGKFILVLDEKDERKFIYKERHSSFNEKVMFTSSDEGEDDSAFFIINEPRTNLDKIKRLVNKGFIVRTRADSGTIEARENDYSRFEAAIESGAQYITTDYYIADPNLNKNFIISLDEHNSKKQK
ncbi:hypothetical protein RJ43_12465 [Alteromonas macleodii]|nr:hypothetical protein RJ43_12465 [Alteromonas macleodii]